MVSRRVRFAFCALLAVALWHVQVMDAQAQQFGKPAAQSTSSAQRQSTPQKKTANQNGQQSTAHGGEDRKRGRKLSRKRRGRLPLRSWIRRSGRRF